MTTTRAQPDVPLNDKTTRALQAYINGTGGTDPLTSFMNELARSIQDAVYQTNADEATPKQIVDADGRVLARVVHSGNNQIIEVLDGRLIAADGVALPTPAIVQISEQKQSTLDAKQFLSGSRRPFYLARETSGLQTVIVNPNDQAADRLSYVLTVMEVAPYTLFTAHQHIRDNKHIEFVINLGRQFSRMLTELRKEDVLWTDVKPGNILFRVRESDHQLELFIADPKGLAIASSLKVGRTSGREGREFIRLEDITPPYHSQAFMDILNQNNIATREQAARMIEEDYSYQLAILLYTAATGREPDLVPLQFNFAQEIFTNDIRGTNLQTLIENLSQPNPDQRLHHSNAIKLLHKLDYLPEEFNQMVASEMQKRAQSPILIPHTQPVSPQRYNSTGNINNVLQQDSKNDVRQSGLLSRLRNKKAASSDGDVPVVRPDSEPDLPAKKSFTSFLKRSKSPKTLKSTEGSPTDEPKGSPSPQRNKE